MRAVEKGPRPSNLLADSVKDADHAGCRVRPKEAFAATVLNDDWEAAAAVIGRDPVL